MPKSATKFNAYDSVTETIAKAVTAGTLPWQKPWTGGAGLAMPLRCCGTPYRGINVVLQWCAAHAAGYTAPRWMTYKQAQALGGQVRKGEKSTTIIKYGSFEITDGGSGQSDAPSQPHSGPASSDSDPEIRMYARAYRVFRANPRSIESKMWSNSRSSAARGREIGLNKTWNRVNVAQIDGLDPEYYAAPDAPRDLGTERNGDLDAWFARLGIHIRETAEPRVYYRPALDDIHMPDIATFTLTAAFYSVLAHESAHAITNKRRLNLEFLSEDKTSSYAFEEVYAQLTSAMVCAQLGIAPRIEMDAAYNKY